ncbi:MAG: response regulator [Chloroflexi bacterium]|nr:response regulator [Chloroflexota bacterium]
MPMNTSPANASDTSSAIGTLVPIAVGNVPAQTATKSVNLVPRTVLIVEDEPGLAEVLALNLQASGFETVTAHDGLQALYLLDQSVPDVVVLDLQLPQVSGFRLIQLLRSRTATARIPIVVITALSFREAEDVVRRGADAFLTKPFAPEEVVNCVERLVARAM